MVLHWIVVIGLAVSLGTGLRIASDDPESIADISGHGWLLSLVPEGAVIDLHLTSSVVVTFALLSYPLYLRLIKRSKRVLPKLRDFRSTLGSTGTARWSAINRLLMQIAFVALIVLAMTGWSMYAGRYSLLAASTVATIHGLSAWTILAYSALHVIAVFKAGTATRMFRPRKAYIGAGAVALLVVGIVMGGGYIAQSKFDVLDVVPTATPPELDGRLDPVWDLAPPVHVRTVRGANLPGGESRVEIRAMHDSESIYFLFRWTDPNRSQKMTPLIKEPEGWRVLQTGLDDHDENAYYEDKFAVILSHDPGLGSGTAHFGQDLLGDTTFRSNRGLHFTRDGSIADLWHWKSIRSGGMTPGFVDDNYIGPPLPPVAPGTRYTGGYTQDPPGAPHPYLQNWEKIDSAQPLSRTLVRPRYLPARPELLRRMEPIDLEPTGHDSGVWHLRMDEVVEYRQELDDYPIGTVLPGIVIDGTFKGDRADVRAEAEWMDGYWTLEVVRRLDTGSEYDISFVSGDEVYLWVAVFNHTQTRHSRHLRPVRVVLSGR